MNDDVIQVFGCDIGNGFGYISLLEDADSDPKPMFPVNPIYPLERIGMPTSAYIMPPDGEAIEVFDGRSARDKNGRDAEKIIDAVKTRLRQGKIPVPGIGRPVSPDRIYAAIARDLVKQGNEKRKADGKEGVYKLAFAFPASFEEDVSLLNRMQKSIESIVIDGKPIEVIARLPEPAAVAIDHLYYLQNLAPEDVRVKKDEYTVLVYDLGHGTFDSAVVTASGKDNSYRMHFQRGIPDVGGQNFDDIIYSEILNNLKIIHGYTPKNRNEEEKIRKEANKVKHQLSNDDVGSCEISLPVGEYANVEISKKKFEELSRHLIVQTMQVVSDLMDLAKNDGIHIDGIVLSGGASQMPMVMDNLKQVLDGEDISVIPYRPSSAVSYGTARYGYWEEERRHREEEGRRRREEEERRCREEEERTRREEEESRRREEEESRRREEEERTRREEEGRRRREEEESRCREEEESRHREEEERRRRKEEESRHREEEERRRRKEEERRHLQKYTGYSYGIWLPSEDNPAGKVQFLVKSREKMPAESRGVRLLSLSDRTVIKVYRSNEKYIFADSARMEECVEILRIPFNIPDHSKYELKMVVLDDYNIQIICIIENGKIIEKSTLDMIDNLIE